MSIVNNVKIKIPELKAKVYNIEALIGLLILAIGLSPSMLAIVINPSRAGSMTVVHLFFTAAIAYVLGIKNLKAALLILLIIIPWQPYLSMPFANILGESGIKILVSTKDVYVASLLGALYIKNAKSIVWTKIDLAAFLFIFVYALYGVISPASKFGVAVSFREGFMIIATYLVGRLSRFELKDLRWFGGAIVLVAIAVLLFGFWEYFGWSEMTWTRWGAGDYFLAKNGVLPRRFSIEGAVPFNWHTGINGTLYRRMVSGIGDPTSLSRYLSLPLLILLFIPLPFIKTRRLSVSWFVLVAIFTFGMLLTFGRGGWIILVIGVSIGMILLHRVFVLLTIPLMFLLLLSPFTSDAFFVHLPSVIRGMEQIVEQPIGRGLGTAGQLALYHSENAIEESGESYLSALSFQTGILGVLVYSGYMFLLSKYLWDVCQYSRRVHKLQYFFPYARLALMLIVGIFATSLFANSAVAPISAGASLIYCGMTITSWHHWILQQQKPEAEVTENVGPS